MNGDRRLAWLEWLLILLMVMLMGIFAPLQGVLMMVEGCRADRPDFYALGCAMLITCGWWWRWIVRSIRKGRPDGGGDGRSGQDKI